MPAIHVDKDFRLFLSVENTLSLDGPCELCGFNVGDLQKGCTPCWMMLIMLGV